MKLKVSSSCFVLLWYFFQIRGEENNVCLTYTDYYTMKDNPRCFYDFSVDKSVPDIITGYGYPLEIHSFTNKNGYILTLFRLPNPKASANKREILFLQHGVCGGSADFVGQNNNSIAFVLFNAGFEVWLGNSRGSDYSKKHVKFTVKDTAYWDYSLDDIALVDLPETFDYMSEVIGQEGNFVYVGHSLGTSLGLMYSSGMPEHAEKMLKFMFLIAPAYTLSNMISPIKVLAPFGPVIVRFLLKANLVPLVSDGVVEREVQDDICLSDPLLMKTCLDFFNLLYGPYTETTADRALYYFNHFPTGISVKATLQFSSFIAKKFSKYDYGYVENMKLYGTPKPPRYNVSIIKIPIRLFAAENDWACTAKDAINLYYKLSPKVRRGFDLIDLDYFNHQDFLFGNDAVNLVYRKIANIIKAF